MTKVAMWPLIFFFYYFIFYFCKLGEISGLWSRVALHWACSLQ